MPNGEAWPISRPPLGNIGILSRANTSFAISRRSSFIRHPCPTHHSFLPLGRVIPPPNLIPVDDVPPRAHVVGPPVLVVEVVGMLPDVVAQKRGLPFHDRAVLVGG